MVQLRHAGIYVSDMNKMVRFYTDVFNMHKICENVIQKDSLIEELLGPGSVLITKLITDYGKITGSGDMLELIYFFDAKNVEDKFIYDQSVVHVFFCGRYKICRRSVKEIIWQTMYRYTCNV